MQPNLPSYLQNLGGLAQFGQGLKPQERQEVEAPGAIVIQEMMISIPHVDGRPIGQVRSVTFSVKMAQLIPALPKETLYPDFDPLTAPLRTGIKEHVDALGDRLPPLHVLPAGRNYITPDGEELPMFYVHDDPEQYQCLRSLQRAEAPVTLMLDTNMQPITLGELILYLFSQKEMQRPQSVLERCKTANILIEVYHYDLKDVAKHIKVDTEHAGIPSTAYVSYLNSVAKLPEPVHAAMRAGDIRFTHAREIATKYGDEPDMCIMLAEWCAPKGGVRLSVGQLTRGMGLLQTGVVHLDRTSDGILELTPTTPALPPPNEEETDTKVSAPQQLIGGRYTPRMGAASPQIKQQAKIFAKRIQVGDRPGTVRQQSVQELQRRLAAIDDDFAYAELEAMVLGFLEATYAAAAAANQISSDGTVAPIVEASIRRAQQA